MSEPKDDPTGHAGKALQAWLNLPDEERSEERPWIMGFNAAWEIQNDRIEAQAKLIEGLRGYVQHNPEICVGGALGRACTCGLTTLLASIKEPPSAD